MPALDRLVYLNTGTASPLSHPVVEAGRALEDRILQEGAAAPSILEACQQAVERARKGLEAILGAPAGTVSLVQSTSDGIGVVASGIDWQEGDEVVTNRLEHVAGLLPWYVLRDRFGVRVHIADGPAERLPERIAELLSPRTRLVCLSHVSYATGERLPVAEVAGLCKDRNGDRTLVLVDAAQSAGALVFRVEELGCDALAAPGQKWLMGPDGTGALYVAPGAMERLWPSRPGWAGQAEHDLDGAYRLHSDARRYETATIPYPAVAGLAAGLELLRGFQEDEPDAGAPRPIPPGLAGAAERVARLATRLKESLVTLPHVRLITPLVPERSAGLVCFTVEGQDPQPFTRHLLEKERILVRWIAHPRCLRASVHFFNTEQDVDALVEAVRRARS